METTTILGRAPERLTVRERERLAGCWVALEIYTPALTPLRRIEAAGRTLTDCIEQLASRGLDPRDFEFTPIQ